MDIIYYEIDNISDYGKLVSYCIEHDVSVFRSYYDNRVLRFYHIDLSDKRLYYVTDKSHLKSLYPDDDQNVIVMKPDFKLDDYGHYKL